MFILTSIRLRSTLISTLLTFIFCIDSRLISNGFASIKKIEVEIESLRTK